MRKEAEYVRFLEKLSANIRAFRLKKGLSQEQMAELGFNYRYYQKLESGKYSPSIRTIYKVADALNVTVSELLK